LFPQKKPVTTSIPSHNNPKASQQPRTRNTYPPKDKKVAAKHHSTHKPETRRAGSTNLLPQLIFTRANPATAKATRRQPSGTVEMTIGFVHSPSQHATQVPPSRLDRRCMPCPCCSSGCPYAKCMPAGKYTDLPWCTDPPGSVYRPMVYPITANVSIAVLPHVHRYQRAACWFFSHEPDSSIYSHMNICSYRYPGTR